MIDGLHARSVRSLRVVALLVGLAVVVVTGLPARALGLPATITVTATNDQSVDNGQCSIAEAMQTAIATRPNDDCGPEVESPVLITFNVSGPIMVQSQLPNPINGSDVSLLGPATFDLSGAGTIVFDVDGGSLNLANLTIAKNTAIALNVHSGATANIAGVSFDGNVAGVPGAAIANAGTLRIAGSNFVGNHSDMDGGAIASNGDLTIAGSNFNGNTATHRGGAIFVNGGHVEIADSIFSGNIATAGSGEGGGALFITSAQSSDTFAVIRSVFSGNLSTKGGGGAIFHNSDVPLTVRDSSFQGNLAGTPVSDARPGGAILSWGTLTVSGSAFLNNGASNNGGAIANGDAGATDQGSPPSRHGVLTLSNTSFTANAAVEKGGAIANLYLSDGPTLTAKNVTFSANVAVTGGALYNGEPQYDVATFTNSIFDGSDSTGGNCADPSGSVATIVSGGHNLDSGSSCSLGQSGDISNQSANLDFPSFNGGPLATLLTQKLKPGSPAIDAGDAQVCAATPVSNKDQRGKVRPQDGNGDGNAQCDIGSFENDPATAGYGSTPVQPGPIPFGNVLVGDTAGADFTVTNTGDATLTVSGATLAGAAAGDYSVTTSFPFTIAVGGAAQTVALTCHPSATGLRAATLMLTTNDPQHASVGYTLVCNGTTLPVPGFGSTPNAPGPLTFGNVVVGQTKSLNVMVEETGDASLHVSNPVLSGANPGDFSFGAGVDVTIADGGAAVAVPLTCTPSEFDIRTATLTLSTNDPTKPSVSFALSCFGDDVPSPILDAPGWSTGNVPGAPNVAGPYGLGLSADGKNLYAADDGDHLLSLFTRNQTNGQLSFLRTIVDGGPDFADDLAGARMVMVSPDGRNVYATAWADDAISAFARNTSTGDLTFLDKVKEGDGYGCFPGPCTAINGLDGAYGIAISPDGQFVYVSSINDSAIVVLRRHPTDGSLVTESPLPLGARFVQSVTHADLVQAYGIAISPDGAFVYATAYNGGTAGQLLVFRRNATDGKLTYVETKYSTSIAGLRGVFRVTLSPDGAFVYTASFNASAVTAFRRDPISGTLTYLATYQDEFRGGSDLQSTTSVAVSPDGTKLYATAYVDNAVTVFRRDTTTGLLVFAQSVRRDAAGQPPLQGARDVGVSPDGRVVYATGRLDNAIVALPLANPRPRLSSLSPASATASPGGLTLTVNGANFVPGAVVRWNNALNLPTTFINSGQLEVGVGVGLISNPGTRPVSVINPTPGGGTSNSLNFTITAPSQNPIPSIAEISPQSTAAGGNALLVTVTGDNFVNGAQVRWNGSDRPTTFVSASALQVQVSVSDVAQPGQAGITVFNPAPGGGTSNAATFEIAAPGQNPVPSILAVSPPSVIAGSLTGSELVLTLTGSGFLSDSQATWDGANRPTTFVNSSQLTMIVGAADLSTPGMASIEVTNPGPGGGVSNAMSFTIGQNGDNPVPALARYSAGVGGGTIQLTLHGSGFIAGSQVFWNGVAHAATVLDGTHIRVTLSAAEYGRAASVRVTNSAPGGGDSNDLLFAPQVVYVPTLHR